MMSQFGVTRKALRHYEDVGLVRPDRLRNGYRDYSDSDILAIGHIRDLTGLGFTVARTKPFLDCLLLGHETADKCMESIIAYRKEIERIESQIHQLEQNRAILEARLASAVDRGFTDLSLPPLSHVETERDPRITEEHPRPILGHRIPNLTFSATDGTTVEPASWGPGRRVVFLYPLTGRPSRDMPRGWDDIPGARGCTQEVCEFRDAVDELRAAGLIGIWGLSTQDTAYQRELSDRLNLPYPLLADPLAQLAGALELPMFSVDGESFYSRLTLVFNGPVIEHVFYPVEPVGHVAEVAAWLEARP